MTRVALRDVGDPASVRQQLQREFRQALDNHESTEDLIDRIRRVCDMSEARARTIAQTERTRAANGQRYADAIDEYLAAYDKAVKGHRKRPALPMFQWINPRRAKEPRPHHVAVSGSKRAIGEEFLPDLRYPGDPQADAREVINCHCYIRRWRP
jgi:hypothetical protein